MGVLGLRNVIAFGTMLRRGGADWNSEQGRVNTDPTKRHVN